MSTRSPSLAEAASMLRDALVGHEDDVPDGWYTAEELASEAGCSHATALRMIRRRLHDGAWECKKFAIRKPTGKLYPTPYYRPKAKS